MMLKDHLEEYEDTGKRGDIWIEGKLPELGGHEADLDCDICGAKVEFHFYHEFGSETYSVDIYDADGNKIGQLGE